MKKVSLYMMAILAFVFLSCNKESESINDAKQQPEGFVISAFFDEQDSEATDVKTVYTDEGTSFSFAWQENDVISVQLYTGGDSSSPNQIKFKASSDGDVSLFHQDGSTYDLTTNHNVEGYSNKNFTLGDYAFYPKEGKGVNTWKLDYSHNSKTVSLASSVDYVDDNPTSVIPLIGKKQDGDGTPNAEYAFRTATGAIKLHINNIPYSATKIVLTSKNTEDVLSAVWTFNQDNANTVYTNGLTMEAAKSSKSYSKTINLSNLSDQDKDIYIPIPIGTIHGFTLQIFSGNTLQFTKSTSKEIEITRARVTVLPEFTVSEWVPLGTAKFKDVKTFSEESHDSFVDVPIQESTTTKGKYRLDDPYGALYTALGKEPAKTPTRYLEFKVVEKGQAVKWEWNSNTSFTASTSNEVAFNYSTAGTDNNGYTYTGHSATSSFVHPGWTTYGETDLVKTNNHVRNRVIAYQDNGLPALIRVCPKYRKDDNSGWLTCGDDKSLLIVFPGCDDYVGLDKISFSNITISNYQSNEGARENLNDGNISSYWHSYYSTGIYAADATYGATIDIDLSSGASKTSVEKLIVNCLMRTDVYDNNVSGMAAEIKVAGKESGAESWTLLTTKAFDVSEVAKAYWLSIPIVTGNTPYEKIRIGVTKAFSNAAGSSTKSLTSNSYSWHTHMAEIELFGN